MNAKNWKLSGNFLDRDVDLIQQKFSLPRPVAVFFASRGITAEVLPVQDEYHFFNLGV